MLAVAGPDSGAMTWMGRWSSHAKTLVTCRCCWLGGVEHFFRRILGFICDSYRDFTSKNWEIHPLGRWKKPATGRGCDSEQYRVALAPHSEARATAPRSAQSRRFDPELLVLSLGSDVNVGPSGLVPCFILYSPWPDSVEMRTSPESCGLWSTAKIFQKANVQTALYFLETKKSSKRTSWYVWNA